MFVDNVDSQTKWAIPCLALPPYINSLHTLPLSKETGDCHEMFAFVITLLNVNTIILFYLWQNTGFVFVDRAGLGKRLLTHVELSKVEFASLSNKMFVFVITLRNVNAIILSYLWQWDVLD